MKDNAKKIWALGVVILSFAACAVADEINFNFTTGPAASVVATSAGFTSGPSALTSISDSTTMANVPFKGSFINANAGPATAFTVIGDVVAITFSASGTDSVLVKDSLSNVLVAGSMRDGGTLLATIPPLGLTGTFLGTFNVSFVSPAALGLFGQTGFQPIGTVAFTSGSGAFDTMTSTYTAVIGGGAVTIQSTVVSEPASLGLMGAGFVTIAAALRRRVAARS